MRRSSSRFTSGRSRTPRTSVKIAALAPMPKAKVTTTVKVSPFAPANDRSADLRSRRKAEIAFAMNAFYTCTELTQYDFRRTTVMTSILSDLRFSLRTIRRSPLFAAVAILSLALGIGANTAIFTLMDQLMLRQLPIKDPEQLVMLYQRGAHNGNNMGYRMHSYPLYRDLQQKAAPFSEVICRRLIETSVSVEKGTERVDGEMVSGNYFSMLGVQPAAGRLFSSQEDDRVSMGHPVVVLSYDYWVTRFNRDPRAVGKKILVNNYPMTIVGVSAAGFYGLDPASSPQIWVPILMKAAMLPEWTWM